MAAPSRSSPGESQELRKLYLEAGGRADDQEYQTVTEADEGWRGTYKLCLIGALFFGMTIVETGDLTFSFGVLVASCSIPLAAQGLQGIDALQIIERVRGTRN